MTVLMELLMRLSNIQIRRFRRSKTERLGHNYLTAFLSQ